MWYCMLIEPPQVGGVKSCEKSVDVPWKIGLKQGKDTNLGVAQVLFDPYKIP